jgi:ribosomal protein S28E/S33
MGFPRRSLIFDQVVDVHSTKGLLRQTKGAGTITLVTQQVVSSGEAQLSNRQIALRNVPGPRKVYDVIRSLALDQGRDR